MYTTEEQLNNYFRGGGTMEELAYQTRQILEIKGQIANHDCLGKYNGCVCTDWELDLEKLERKKSFTEGELTEPF